MPRQRRPEAGIDGAVERMLRSNLRVREGERVLVLTDAPVPGDWPERGEAELRALSERALLAKEVASAASAALGEGRVSLLAIPAPRTHGSEPTREAVEAMARSHAVLALTTYSITHTRGREEACSRGARVASMPGFERRMLEAGGALAADPEEVRARCGRLLSLLAGAREARVTAPGGTDLSLSVEGRPFVADTGMVAEPGSVGNLPGGEVYAAPVEGSAEGRLVVPAGWHPGLSEPLSVAFERGLAASVEGGGAVGDRLRALLGLGGARVGARTARARRNCAELGVGANPNARRADVVLEAEKVLGTVHVALGNNAHFGGLVEADLHQDLVLPRPTLEVDGRTLMRRGRPAGW